MITHPILPPKRGYVEVVVSGEHVYKNAVTGVLERDETPVSDEISVDELLDILMGGDAG